MDTRRVTCANIKHGEESRTLFIIRRAQHSSEVGFREHPMALIVCEVYHYVPRIRALMCRRLAESETVVVGLGSGDLRDAVRAMDGRLCRRLMGVCADGSDGVG